jgi:hypothetical protein
VPLGSPCVSSEAVSVIFDGTFPVAYWQADVLGPDQVNSDLEEAFVGQRNGLLGGSVQGQLWLTTGLHSGYVALGVEVRVQGEPPADDAWQEVVEVSFVPTTAAAALTAWAGQGNPIPLGLEVAPYRVRMCASGMDEARQQDTLLEGEPIDKYLLVFWKAEPEPDRVVKQTSQVAESSHNWAQSLRRT